MKQLRVAIVHDDLVQWGGAERVLLGLCEIFPDAPIYTSVFDSDNSHLAEKFSDKKIITSFLQKIPGWEYLYKALLPFYPIAFEQFDFTKYDLVISHTTRFAKSIITKPQTLHISFCHTPPRFLWHFSGTNSYGVCELLMTKLRIFDQISSQRVDHFIAGSQNAQKRIAKIYKRSATVVYPFVDLDRFQDVEVFDGGYFVVIGRKNHYKRFDLAKAACKKLNVELKIIEGDLKDEIVTYILAGCKALIISAEEDFGIASLEAQALGKPVIALGLGGALETVINGKTGILFTSQTVDSLINAMKKLGLKKINPLECKQNAKRFNKENFISNFKQAVASLVYT